MKYRSILIISFFLVIMGSEAFAQSTNDLKLWLDFTAQFELTDTLRLDIEEDLRLDDTWTGYEKSFTEIGLRFRPTQYLKLSGYYRYIIADEIQQRGAADVELSYDISRLDLSYRLRLQSTTSANNGTRTYIRNKVKGAYKLSKPIEPFAAFELHYQTTNAEFREVRMYLGLSYKLSKKMDIDGYYMYQNEFNVAVPEHNHIIGLGLSYEFRSVGKSSTEPAGDVD